MCHVNQGLVKNESQYLVCPEQLLLIYLLVEERLASRYLIQMSI